MVFRTRWLALAALLGCEGGAPQEETRTVSEAVEQCPAQSVEGVDVFDGQGRVDWAAVARTGVRFAFIKATQGTYDTQSTFGFNWSQAESAGILRSAYHFFDPTEDGAAQAGHFLSVVGKTAPGDLPPMLDIECPDGDSSCLYSGASGAASATEITTRMWAFLEAVEEATGSKPILYTFGVYLAENGVVTSGLSAYPLALAYPSDAACIQPPAPWARAAFWQYSWAGSVDGIVVPVDRDRFLGSLPELQALASPVAASAPAAAAASASPSASASAPASAPASPPIAGYVSSLSDAEAPTRGLTGDGATRSGGCNLAPARPRWSTPPAISLASVFLARKRRRAVARRGARVLAGRSATPCKRPIFARA
jgi:lysozyme